MKLIDAKVDELVQKPSIDGVFEAIENAARTCYKSEPKDSITPYEFVNRLINSRHTAMLEHGTMYLDVPLGTPLEDSDYLLRSDIILFFSKNAYSRVNKYVKTHNVDGVSMPINHYAITTNYRVFIEQYPWDTCGNIREDKLSGHKIGMSKEYMLQYLCEPNEHHEKRYSFRITTDRGVTHELVRHRVFSFAQESTRYCNYSKDKFGNELTFVKPSWYGKDNFKSTILQDNFNRACAEAETEYLFMLSNQATPQEARAVLPNAIKTEIVMTGFESDWKHFLDLRYKGLTGKPHPDMYIVAEKINELIQNKYE